MKVDKPLSEKTKPNNDNYNKDTSTRYLVILATMKYKKLRFAELLISLGEIYQWD